jgi:hypothetical protein
MSIFLKSFVLVDTNPKNLNKMNKFFTLSALAITMAAQAASADDNTTVSSNKQMSDMFPIEFSQGVPAGWDIFAGINGANTLATTEVVKGGLKVTYPQSAPSYRADIKYNMYSYSKDEKFDIDADTYKIFAVKFKGSRPSGSLKLSNISVIGSDGKSTWIKGTDGYSLSETGWTDIKDGFGDHTYYWTIGGDNWTSTKTIDKIEIVIADNKVEDETSYTVASINWFESEDALKNSLQMDPVKNLTTGVGYEDITKAWTSAVNNDVIMVYGNQDISTRLNCDSRNITIKGYDEDVTITRKARSNMMFLSNQNGYTVTIENITLDGNGEDTDKNLIEASSSGIMVLNNVTIKNAKSNNGLGLVVAKSSGKVALNGVKFVDCVTPNDNHVEVFIGANGSSISGNNVANIAVEKGNYTISASELTNESPIVITPIQDSGEKDDNNLSIYNVVNYTEGKTVVSNFSDPTKFLLNCADAMHVEYDVDVNGLVAKNGTPENNEDNGEQSSVNVIDANADNSTPVYYNLNGIEVANPGTGIYIVRRGNKVSKIYVK